MDKVFYYPSNYPQIMSGKLTYKVKIKDDYVRADGTSAIYIQVFLNEKIPRKIPLDFSVEKKCFDKNRGKVLSNHPYYKDYNLLIEKKLADINSIEVKYRLSGSNLTLSILMEELNNPSARLDFVKFWETEIALQKGFLKKSTYDAQLSLLKKLKEFKQNISFFEIDEPFVAQLKLWMKTKKGNSAITIETFMKSFKKYLHVANKKGIRTPLAFDQIKVKKHLGNRAFLSTDEIKILYKHWSNDYINSTHKNVLGRFLFSCFTGLRIADIQRITHENIFDNLIVFNAEKTDKLHRIPLNQSAKKFINPGKVFKGEYTDQTINLNLKEIAKACGISKKVTFHVSRHTFATNFLICGGRVEHLQKILGHSDIKETMIYVNIVEQITNMQIHNMDEILF